MKTFKNALFAKILAFMCAGLVGFGTFASTMSATTIISYAADPEGEAGDDTTITSAGLDGVVSGVEDGLSDVKKAIVRICDVLFIVAIGFIVVTIIVEHDPRSLKTKLGAGLIVMAAVFILRLAVNGVLLNIVNQLANKAGG